MVYVKQTLLTPNPEIVRNWGKVLGQTACCKLFVTTHCEMCSNVMELSLKGKVSASTKSHGGWDGESGD